MGILSSIFDRLRGRTSAQQETGVQPTTTASQQPQQPSAPSGQQLQNVDIDKVLRDMAAKKGGGGNYQESSVDLLKLLDLDASLNARKELARELNVNAGSMAAPSRTSLCTRR